MLTRQKLVPNQGVDYALQIVVSLVVILLSCNHVQTFNDTYTHKIEAQKVEKLVEQPASVNLKTIFDHQEALRSECSKYHAHNKYQLSQLIQFEEGNNQFHLPKPILVKVPSICLFISDRAGEELGTVINNGDYPSTSSRKLDLVNWIYNADEIRNVKAASGFQKRETESGGKFLSNFLLDPSEVSTNKLDGGDEDDDLDRFHQDIGKMMADNRFIEAIDKHRKDIVKHLSPVVLIPGLLGSRLQAKTRKTNRVNIFCSKQSDWQDLWLSFRSLLPVAVDCWLDNVRLDYDPDTGFTRSPVGVLSRVPDFGSIGSVSYLDLAQPNLSGYYKPLIDRYIQLGYIPDLNLLAAPYDFRLAPQELEDSYYVELKHLIETANLSNDKKVTLVCHSMGCTNTLIFLRQQSSDWRQNNIRKLIALSSPWGGAVKALKALVVGDSLDMPLVNENKMKTLARTFPSIAFLLPQTEVFNQTNRYQPDPPAGGQILIQTPERAYRVSDMDQLLRDVNLTLQLDWFRQTTPLIKPLEPLRDVHVDCIYSSNIPTPEKMIFRKQSDFPDGDYELVSGPGDGTVNLNSLMICEYWASLVPDLIRYKEIRGVNHMGIIGSKETLAHITDDVFLLRNSD